MQGSIDFTGLLSGDIIGEGGTEVIANPTGTPTENINTIEISDVIYQIVGEEGPQGPQGETGPQGPAGEGVPTGGSAGQVLVKDSATDYDTSWTSLDASDIPYDNTTSGMTATDVQDAVSELKSNLTQLNGLNVVKRITTPATVVSFSDGSNLPMYKLLLSIETVQEGSGDPSPENIRPISGFTETNVIVSPTTDAEDGTTYNIQFKDGSNPLTVYGGTLDVVSGVLVVDRAILDLGNYSWNKGNMNIAKTGRIFYFAPPSSLKMKKPSDNGKCTIFNYNPFSNWPAGQWERQILNAITITNSNAVVACAKDIYSTASDFKTAVSGQKLVYELATPITYQLTPTQVKSLLGSNNVWADTGDILEVDYTAILNFS